MKRRSITLLVCLLMCLALGSVGFAAWVITNDASSGDNGHIRVDVVKDMRLDITAEIKGDNTLIFGSKEAKDQDGWMKYEETEVTENAGTNDERTLLLDEKLSFTVEVTIGNYSSLNKSGTALALTLAEDQTVNFAAAVAKGYVKALPSVELTVYDIEAGRKGVENYSYDSETDTATFDVKFELEWGNLFDFDHDHEYKTYQNGEETIEMCDCGKPKPAAHQHSYELGFCTVCGAEIESHQHQYGSLGTCQVPGCNRVCAHEYVEGICKHCNAEHNHGEGVDAEDCACNIIGVGPDHEHYFGINSGICQCGERKAQNPIDHYNQFDYHKLLGDDALEKLGELKKLLDNVNYVLTVEATPDVE